ncbi:MAG: Sec-independent protein translocase protein TatB [Pseudomonadales bacterium]|jgi:sec-independent protein translocase protein TatB|nr:Sec-independent protein translocase protein TatB [Pseudomonadales bacterium]
MFDIGFPELLLVAIVLLLVVGPDRLPEVLRTVGRWMGSARRSFDSLRAEIEREVGADEIRRDLENARIVEEAKRLQNTIATSRDEVEEMLGKRYAELKAAGSIDDPSKPAADAAPKVPQPDPSAVDEAGPAAAPVQDPSATTAHPHAGATKADDHRDAEDAAGTDDRSRSKPEQKR